MLARSFDENAQPTPLGPDELDAALKLLATEEAAAHRHWREAAGEFGRTVAFGIASFALPVGTFVVFFESIWGIVLLGAGVIAGFIFGWLAADGGRPNTQSLRTAIARSDIGEAAATVWLRRTRLQSAIFGVVVLLCPVAFVAGLVWLAKSAFFDGDVPAPSLAVMAGATLLFWTWVAVYTLNQYRYYSLVAEARTRLEKRSAPGQPAGNEVGVFPDELAVLSQAEEQAFERKVKTAVKRAPRVLDEAYAVSIEPDAGAYLDNLSRESPEAWQRVVGVIHSLQFDPQPREAHPADAGSALEIETEVGTIDYAVDLKSQRVKIISIEDEPKQPDV